MEKERAFPDLFHEASQGRLSRREVVKRAVALGLSAPTIAALVAACGGSASAPTATTSTNGGATAASGAGAASPAASQGTRGGTLKIAMIGEPPTLDLHQTTGTIVALIGWNMYEPLFAWDANFKLIPMLAESHETSSDGLTNTLKLRKGVPFHNGAEMKAADVIASIQRWAGMSGLGKSLLDTTETITKADDYTIEFKMKRPFGVFAEALGLINQGCAIYPKSVIDAAGQNPLKEFISTGPYKFVEHQPDRLIRLERFQDYAALPGQPNGYGGHKAAYLDRIDFIPVPDEAARIAGLQSGDYDYPESISTDQYETLKGSPNVVADVLPPLGWGVFLLNMKQGVMANIKMRQAFQAALDDGPICEAGYGSGFYRLDPSIMFKETVWYTEVGKERYNRHDPEAAKRLLKEANYDGAPVRFTCTKQYLDHYNRSVVAKQQLEAVGFTIDLKIFDWATVLSQQQQPDKWDVTTTGITFRPDPAQLAILDVCHFAGWWCVDDTTALVDQLRSASDFKTRYGIWEKVQQNFYEQVPMIKVGDGLQAFVRSKRLQGLSSQTQLGPILWNTWLK